MPWWQVSAKQSTPISLTHQSNSILTSVLNKTYNGHVAKFAVINGTVDCRYDNLLPVIAILALWRPPCLADISGKNTMDRTTYSHIFNFFIQSSLRDYCDLFTHILGYYLMGKTLFEPVLTCLELNSYNKIE